MHSVGIAAVRTTLPAWTDGTRLSDIGVARPLQIPSEDDFVSRAMVASLLTHVAFRVNCS